MYVIWKADLNSDLCFGCKSFPQLQLQIPSAWENSYFGKTGHVTSMWVMSTDQGAGYEPKDERSADVLLVIFCSVIACWGSWNLCKLEQSEDWQFSQRSRWSYSTIDSLIRVWYNWTSTWLKGICKRFATEPGSGQKNSYCKLVCTSVTVLRI